MSGFWERSVIDVLIAHAISGWETVPYEWHVAMDEIVANAPRGLRIVRMRFPEPVVDISRDKAAQVAIQNGAKWVWFVDTDLIWPPDTLARLMRHNKPIVGGLYVRRHNPPFNEMLKFRTDGVAGLRPIQDGEYAPNSLVECVKPDTIILGSNKLISQLLVGDDAASKTGLAVITKTYRHHYSGEMVRIKAAGLLPVEATPEHPILVVTSKSGLNKKWNRAVLGFTGPYWKPAKDLKPKHENTEGDFLLVPRLGGQTSAKSVDLRPYTKKKGSGWAGSLDFPIDEESAWLLGIYVAEGSKSGTHLEFSLNTNERGLQQRIIRAAKRLSYAVWPRTEGSVTKVLVSSSLLPRAFPDWCGNLATTKRIPDFVLYHNDERILKAFLMGYLDGDASFDRKLKGYRGNTVSKLLALQLQILCARLGFFLYLYKGKPDRTGYIQGRRVHEHEQYQLAVKFTERVNPRARITKDYIICPITSVRTTEQYDGDVFNLETTDHTYLVSNAVIHNCDAVATGCMLIQTDVFEKMQPYQLTVDGQPARPAWFLWTEWRTPIGFSEDFSFCAKARQNGIPVYCDTSIQGKHIGPIKFLPSGNNQLNLEFVG